MTEYWTSCGHWLLKTGSAWPESSSHYQSRSTTLRQLSRARHEVAGDRHETCPRRPAGQSIAESLAPAPPSVRVLPGRQLRYPEEAKAFPVRNVQYAVPITREKLRKLLTLAPILPLPTPCKARQKGNTPCKFAVITVSKHGDASDADCDHHHLSSLTSNSSARNGAPHP